VNKHPANPFGLPPARLAVLAGLLLLLATAPRLLRADVLIGTNGERFVGQVITESTNEVVFKSELGGMLTIPRSRIQEIQAASPTAPMSNSPVAVQPVPITNQLSTFNSQPSTNKVVPAWFVLPKSGEDFDWIQLKKGEWLKGRLESMQNRKLEFDSDQFDEQTFDWDDIQRVWTPNAKELSFEKAGRATGSVLITRDEVFVMDGQTNSYPRADLMSIAPSGKREWNNWLAKFTLGINFASGNTRQFEYSSHLALSRITPSSRLIFDYLGNYGELNGVENANNQRIKSSFDYFLSRRLYVRVPYAEYYKDPLLNLSYRVTLGAGVGYDLIANSRTTWTINLGPGYQLNQYDSVEAGGAASQQAAAAIFGSRFDIALTKRTDLLLEYTGQLTGQEAGGSSHHSVATLSVSITRRLDLDISAVWDRLANPKTEANGNTPLKDDFRLTLGLGIKL
jgi:hypothetical protein